MATLPRNIKWRILLRGLASGITELARYWTSKVGNALITYFDLDKRGL